MATRRDRLRRYGFTTERFEQLLSDQGGRCAICKRDGNQPWPNFFIDHDHRCCPPGGSCGKCVRGLLCSPCNTQLGTYERALDHCRQRETIDPLNEYILARPIPGLPLVTPGVAGPACRAKACGRRFPMVPRRRSGFRVIKYHPDWLRSNASKIRSSLHSQMDVNTEITARTLDRQEGEMLAGLDQRYAVRGDLSRLERLGRLREHAAQRALVLEHLEELERLRLKDAKRIRTRLAALDHFLATGNMPSGGWNLATGATAASAGEPLASRIATTEYGKPAVAQ